MPHLELESEMAAHLMYILANAEGKGITWAIVNPLLMEVGNQLRGQAMRQQAGSQSAARFTTPGSQAVGDGKEVDHVER